MYIALSFVEIRNNIYFSVRFLYHKLNIFFQRYLKEKYNYKFNAINF